MYRLGFAFRSAAELVLTVVLIGVVGTAAVRVDILSAARDATPGDVVTHVFAVLHDEPVARTFSLEIAAPSGWSALSPLSDVTIAPGVEETVFVTIVVPFDALAATYTVSLRATSTANPLDVGSAGASTRIATVNGVDVTPPAGASVAPGTTVSYGFVVANRGNAQDVIALSAASSRGFPVGLPVGSLALSPRESRTVTVVLSIPVDAAPGSDVLTLRAASDIYTTVEDEAAVFTTLLPPSPDAVGGSLLETLPIRLSLGIERDEIAGTFGSRLSLSTSGTVLGGDLTASLAALHPFGPDPLLVTAYSVAYQLGPATFQLGNASERVTDLFSVTCNGASVRLSSPWMEALIVGGGAAGETRFGGALEVGPSIARVGFAYVDARDGSTRRAAWTGLVRSEPLSGWTVRAEGGWGHSDGKLGRAVFFASDLSVGGYFASGAAYSIGTHFPSPRPDRAGVELSQRLRLSALSIGLSMSHSRSNVLGDPLADTRAVSQLGGDLEAQPFEAGPTLRAALQFSRDRGAAVPSDDKIAVLLAGSVGDTDSPLSYDFGVRVEDRIDRGLGTHIRSLGFSQRLGLPLEAFAVSVTFEQGRVTDSVSDLVLSRTASAALSLRPIGAAHEATISLRSSGDDFRLDAVLAIHPMERMDLTFDGSIDWTRGPDPDVHFGWGIELGVTFDVPIPFLVTRGRLEGALYVDRNASGTLDEGDAPAAGAVISADGVEVSTDASGAYRFPPLAPGRYELTVRGLPRDARFAGPVPVDIAAGKHRILDIALTPVHIVRGAVFADEDRDGIRQSGELGWPDVRVFLSAAERQVAAVRTDASGAFTFVDVESGLYTVSLDDSSLPVRWEPTSATRQSVLAGPSSSELLFGGVVPPRQVVVTFQPPTAEISFSPAAPRVGEAVTFDGSSSFDFSGDIAAYAWDVDDDGTIDSTEAIAAFTFFSVGRRVVRLTVTNNVGDADSVVVEVVVNAASTTSPAATVIRPPIADFTYAPIAPRTEETVRFDASASVDFDGGIVRYAWDFTGDGRDDAIGPVVSTAFPSPGRYAVTLTVTDDVGSSDTATATLDVTAAPPTGAVGTPPIALFVFTPQSPIAGFPVRFDATSSADPDGTIAGYAWDFDADGETDATDPVVERTFAAAAEVVTVRLTVVDDAGLSGTTTLSFFIAAPAVPSGAGVSLPPIADLQYMPLVPLLGEPVMFNASSSVDLDGRIVSTTWDFTGDGVPDAVGAIAVYVFPSRGAFTVSVTVVDDTGNSDTATAEIVIE